MLLLEEKKITQSIITLGGKGTRLESITKGIPKPLFPINGLSPLERAIKILSVITPIKNKRFRVLLINIESESEAKLINKISKNMNRVTSIGIRINPGIDANTISKISTGENEEY